MGVGQLGVDGGEHLGERRGLTGERPPVTVVVTTAGRGDRGVELGPLIQRRHHWRAPARAAAVDRPEPVDHGRAVDRVLERVMNGEGDAEG
jgi:hypothetical protein